MSSNPDGSVTCDFQVPTSVSGFSEICECEKNSTLYCKRSEDRDCSCGASRSKSPSARVGSSAANDKVYVIGRIGFDFPSEARRQSISQAMGAGSDPHDPADILTYLEEHPYDAGSILWTINIETTPAYVIALGGPFGHLIAERLLLCLKSQLEEGVERISVPGHVSGTLSLAPNRSLPIIQPELRGVFSWTTKALAEAIAGKEKPSEDTQEVVRAVSRFLDRADMHMRNLGRTPSDRALNSAITHAFEYGPVFVDAVRQSLELIQVDVQRSPIAPNDREVWDVSLSFIDPSNVANEARRVYQLAIDVTDVVPFVFGGMRFHYAR